MYIDDGVGEEPIVVSQHFSNTDENNNQGSNLEISITPLVVKPHKGRLFGLGTSQLEIYDQIDPPTLFLTRQARLEKKLINLIGTVNLMSQQLTALCEARGVAASNVSTNLSPSSPPRTNEQRI